MKSAILTECKFALCGAEFEFLCGLATVTSRITFVL